jgi:GPI mannosyltransferase 2
MSPDDGRLSSSFISVADRIAAAKRRTCLLIGVAVVVRIAMLLLMGLSQLLPDFISGDDSLATFDLRLVGTIMDNTTTGSSRPFALDGSFCDCFFQCTTGNPSLPTMTTTTTTPPVATPFPGRETTADKVWAFLLTPLTRWDAARFLRLAHEPLRRHPRLRRQRWLLLRQTGPQQQNDESCSHADNDSATLLRDAEQAHAFLPLFPFAIQMTATLFLLLVPKPYLPPTCEGTLALSAWVLNTACFVWSALALYHVTRVYLIAPPRRQDYEGDAAATAWATRVALLFIINPANVFFGTAYSEALGSALVFTGCLFFAHFDDAQTKQQQLKQKRARWCGLRPIALLFMSWCCFLLSCWVRSNGTIYAGFFALFALGRALSTLVGEQRISWGTSFSSTCWFLFLAMMLVLCSIICHNYVAVQRYCEGNDDVIPQWCQQGTWFNLYGHVQRVHWDVGPFRYYQPKQIPNFLLAGPVLSISLLAIVGWIRSSWQRRQTQRAGHKTTTTGWSIVDWAIHALADFALPPPTSPPGAVLAANDELCGGAKVLGHYAVLAASTLIVLVVAHVQIGTRLILSTCPAIYWYMAAMVSRQTRTSDWILVWCLSYHILGLVMHPNWLPWT